jgi:hypothetical protein
MAATYPDSYTVGLPTIEMEEYERTDEQIAEILNELKKGGSSFCKGQGDMLVKSELENKNMYGFLYKLGDERTLVGLALFYVDDVPEGIKIGGTLFESPTKMIKGEVRCSAIKGIGRSIQGDIEDFAKHNKIPLIQIQASSSNQKNKYYIPKLGYQESNANSSENSLGYIYKVVKGGKRNRKTRKTRKTKQKIHTQKVKKYFS